MKDNGFAFFVMNWQLAVSVLSQHLQDLYFYMRDAWLCYGDVRARRGWGRRRFLGWHGRARQPGPVLPPQPEAGQPGGTGATPASGISLGWRPGQAVGPRVGLAWWGPWLSRGSWGPALLRHEWGRDQWSCGPQVGSWALGRLGGAPGLGRGRQGWRCPWGSDFWAQSFSFCSSSTDLLEQVAYFLSWLHDPRPEERFIAKKVIYLAIPTVRPEYLLRFCVG